MPATPAPTITAAAVSAIGRNLTAPASTTACSSGSPSLATAARRDGDAVGAQPAASTASHTRTAAAARRALASGTDT